MGFELEFKGKKLKLSAKGSKASPDELKGLLEALQRIEQVVAEPQLRERVVRQLKTEILETADNGEEIVQGWWDVPQDLIKQKEASKFLVMEADLNPAVHYEKATLKFKVIVDQQGRQNIFDRDQAQALLQKPSIAESLKNTTAALIRIKGTLGDGAHAEIEDYFRNALSVDRLKILFDKRNYDSRASIEFVMFGDFFDD